MEEQGLQKGEGKEMYHEADDNEGNHHLSAPALLCQRVRWPDDCESSETSVATGQER